MRYRVTISIGLGGKRVDYFEVDDADIAELSPEEVEKLLEEMAQDVLNNHLDWTYEPVED